MLNKLCEPEHLAIIILVLLTALLVVGAGKGGGKLLLQLLKKVFGKEEININLGGDDMAGVKGQVLCDPDKCTPMAKVKQQQQQNIKDIAGLSGQLHGLTDLFFKKLNFIKSQNEVILRAMMKNNQLSESDIPKE
jgi:hypothetical protein